ncbi:MAG: serine protease inhibitor [Synechococcaceae cyanobacterium]
MRSAKVRPQLAVRPARLGPPSPSQPLGLHILLAVGLLVLVAAALAPEHPQHQAAICQRHNGAAACRVW